MLTTEQVLERLKQEGITENIQMVRRWIRNGELPAQAPSKRKDGYLVDEADLSAFIEKKRKKPNKTAEEYEAEIQGLMAELARVKEENSQLQKELEKEQNIKSAVEADLQEAFDRLEQKNNDSAVNWKRKYDQQVARSKESLFEKNKLHNEIQALRYQLDELKKKVNPDDIKSLVPTRLPSYKNEVVDILEGTIEGSHKLQRYTAPYKLQFMMDIGPYFDLGNLKDENRELETIIFKRLRKKHSMLYEQLTVKAQENEAIIKERGIELPHMSELLKSTD